MKRFDAKIQWKVNDLDKLASIFAEIVLGRPSAKCKHFGICKMKKINFRTFLMDTSKNNKCSKKAYAFVSLKPNVYFELAFLRQYLDPNVFRLHFESGIFSVDEEYITNSNFMEYIIHIQKGEYKVDFSDTLLTIRFGLGQEAGHS